MTGAERRTQIVEEIKKNNTPVSATRLASLFNVSRQVIVSDIALIRTSGIDISSTNRGYIINVSAKKSRILKVKHTDEQLKEELNAIVDLGGCVENVVVNHRVYGRLEAPLKIDSGKKVREFLENIRSGKSSPLKNITSDYHYHKITADSNEILDDIEKDLKKRGFLVEQGK